MNEGPYRMAAKTSHEQATRLPFGRFGQDAKLSLVELLSVIFRHKWKAVSVSTLIAVATVGFVFSMKDTYRSEAKILMRDVNRTISLDPSASDAITGEFRPMQQRATDELAILTSHELAVNVVDEIGPMAVLPQTSRGTVHAVTVEGVPQEFSGDFNKFYNSAVAAVKLGLESKIDGHVISLAYEAGTPDAAHSVLKGLVDSYKQRHLEIMSPAFAPGFFSEQAEATRAELTKAQEKLDALRTEHGLVDIVEQKSAAYTRQAELEAQLSAAQVEVGKLQAVVASLDESLASRTRTMEKGRKTVVNETKRELQEQLRALKFEELDLQVRYLDDGPPLVAVREKIAIVEAELASQPADDTEVVLELDATRQSIEQSRATKAAELQAARASEIALAKQVEDAKARIEFLEKNAPMAMQLQAEVDRLRSDYKDVKESERKAIMAQGSAGVANISVIQEPVKPSDPVNAQKLRNLLLGLFAAVFAGIGCAFIFEQLDDSLKNSGEAEKKLNLPVLATIAYEKTG